VFQNGDESFQLTATAANDRPENKVALQKMTEYRIAFDSDIAKECRAAVEQKLNTYACLYNNTFFLFNPTQKLSYPQWLAYFNAHRSQMEAHYTKALTKIDSIEEASCREFRDSFPPTKQLLTSGNTPILLIGLGIYNYDEVVPLSDITVLNPNNFVNAAGETIAIQQAYLVLEGINGIINCSKKVYHAKGYVNKLFIEAENGRRYLATLTAKREQVVFKDVTAETITLKGLKQVLQLK